MRGGEGEGVSEEGVRKEKRERGEKGARIEKESATEFV